MDKDNKVIDGNDNDVVDSVEEISQKSISDAQNVNSSDDWKVVQKSEHKGSNVLKAIGIVIAIVIILGGMAWSGMKFYDLSQAPTYNKPEGEPNQVVGNNKEIGARSGGTESTNIKRVTMDDDLVRVARDLDICLGD